jgi:F-type H+-transporting ATPase subunit b
MAIDRFPILATIARGVTCAAIVVLMAITIPTTAQAGPKTSVDAMPLVTSGPEGTPVLGHDTNAHADPHHKSASAGLPQFDTRWFPSQLFWLAITFAVMYGFFSRIALPRIADTITARQTKIQSDLNTAETLTKQAQSIRSSYERDMNHAHERATQSLHSIEARIKEKTADLMYSYRTKVSLEMTRTTEELDREKNNLARAMRDLAAEIAADSAGKILSRSPDLEGAQRVVDGLDPQKKRAA